MNSVILGLFEDWFLEAQKKVVLYPEAMTLSTVSKEGRPSSRTVLLKKYDNEGFVFYTNLLSRKGVEIDRNHMGALQFYWRESRKQIRIEGRLHLVDANEADRYFASRDRMSQVGAWASKQSQECTPMGFKMRVAQKSLEFGVEPIPRPYFWSGYRLVPDLIEFWEERPFRLHDRRFFKKNQWRKVESNLSLSLGFHSPQ